MTYQEILYAAGLPVGRNAIIDYCVAYQGCSSTHTWKTDTDDQKIAALIGSSGQTCSMTTGSSVGLAVASTRFQAAKSLSSRGRNRTSITRSSGPRNGMPAGTTTKRLPCATAGSPTRSCM